MVTIIKPSDLLDELLNKFSYPGLGPPMDFIPRDPSFIPRTVSFRSGTRH